MLGLPPAFNLSHDQTLQLKNLLPLPEGKRGKLRKACFTYRISAQIQFRNQKFCNELFGHLLYLNGYLTTIPTSAHTSVFILFLRVKPPLGLALLLWVTPEARCAFYIAFRVVQALFSFILKKTFKLKAVTSAIIFNQKVNQLYQ